MVRVSARPGVRLGVETPDFFPLSSPLSSLSSGQVLTVGCLGRKQKRFFSPRFPFFNS